MRREIGMFIALFVLCLTLHFSNSSFHEEANVLNVVRQVSMLGILAIGSAFVIITGGIDLSVGSVVGLTGVIIAYFSVPGEGRTPHSIGFAITVAMAIALGIGLVQGLLITRLNLQPFIVTLGFMLMLRGVSQTIVQGGNISFGSDSTFPQLANLGYFLNADGDAARLPYLALIFMVVAVVAGYLLHFTVFGRYLFAIGGNRDASEYSGIAVKRVETVTYVISAGLAGVAGVCYAAYIGQMNQTVGVSYELSAIAACVLGGCSLRGGEGTIIGVIIGTGMIKIIDNGLDVFHIRYKDASGVEQLWKPDENWKNIVIGVVILLAVILDQLVHLIQKRRRTRAAGIVSAPPPPSAFPVVMADNVEK